MRLLFYKMPVIDWQVDRNYLNRNDIDAPPSKTLEDIYNWHLSRTEKDKYDEFGLLYYNVGTEAAKRFAHYANLNPLTKLIDEDTPPPLFNQIRIPIDDDNTGFVLKPGATMKLPSLRLRPFWSSKYRNLNNVEKDFFKSWYTIEKNIFYRKEQKIHEQRLLYVKNPQLYEDVLATMLALPPDKFDNEERPNYKAYHKHMADIELSEVFQNWWKVYLLDSKDGKDFEISKAYFDNNILVLLPLFKDVFVVPANSQKKRKKDDRQLSFVLINMSANTALSYSRSWQDDEEVKDSIRSTQESIDSVGIMKWAIALQTNRRLSSGALYDFGPGLLQYDKDIGPLHGNYITENVYHNKIGVYATPTKSIEHVCDMPGAYCYKS